MAGQEGHSFKTLKSQDGRIGLHLGLAAFVVVAMVDGDSYG